MSSVTIEAGRATLGRVPANMDVYHGLDGFTPPTSGITLTVGNFDGVHRGHQRIIDKAREVATALGAPLAVMTFEPHPLAVVAPQRVPPRLTTLEEKLHLLSAAGASIALVLRSEPELLALSADAFLDMLAERCRLRAIIEGPDFNFGRGRGGSVETLSEHARRRGYQVHVIQTTRCAGLPGAPSVHSSAIRAALREGRVDVAHEMLGRPYRIAGRVTTGARRGAGLGFPTANVADIPHMLPKDGVYAAVAQQADGSLHLAAVNVGPQPTFGSDTFRVEAHLLEWSGDALTGRPLGLHLLARLRAQQRFADSRDLVERIRADVEHTRRQAAVLRALERSACVPLPA